jgi:hypothetical protein
MAKYFDDKKWSEVVKSANWYLQISNEWQKILKQAETEGGDSLKNAKEEVCHFFETHLANHEVSLGADGPNWDVERKPIDTIIIHHTKILAGVTWERLNALQLVRLYASYYASPSYEEDAHIKGQSIFSHHFRNNEQVFYAYHWLVRMDGQVERLLNDNEVGWHAGNWEVNCKSIAICLDNDFENSSPSDLVISSVVRLIRDNYSQVRTENIFGHREINPRTTCPSNNFLNGWKLQILDGLKKIG